MLVENDNQIEEFINPFNYEKDKFHIVIKKYQKKTNAILNIIIDENGKVIHSEEDISLDSLDKKYLGIYTELMSIHEENVELQDIKSDLEINSYYEKGNLLLYDFIYLIEQLTGEQSIYSILPHILDLSCILPDSNRKSKKILKCFLEDKSKPHKLCLLIQ